MRRTLGAILAGATLGLAVAALVSEHRAEAAAPVACPTPSQTTATPRPTLSSPAPRPTPSDPTTPPSPDPTGSPTSSPTSTASATTSPDSSEPATPPEAVVAPVAYAPCTTPPAEPRECEAYYYTGTQVSLCEVFPDATKLNCEQAVYRVSLVDADVDPWGLDNGGTRGVGCEANPLAPVRPSADPTTSPVAGELPLTGSSGIPSVALWGLGAVAVGALLGLVAAIRFRRTRFEA